MSSKSKALLALGAKGPFRASDLEPLGIPRAYLQRWQAKGLIEKVDRGLYRATDADFTEKRDLVDVVRRVPKGVICLISALAVHELTTQIPHVVWLMIDRRARAPQIKYPPVKVIRASGPALSHGIQTRTIEGTRVRITTPAKTVADCFRFRNVVGQDVALEALREYLAKRRSGPAYGIQTLVEAATAARIKTVLLPYLEALVEQ